MTGRSTLHPPSSTLNFRLLLLLMTVLSASTLPSSSYADQVIMKDGTVYKGKIMIDTDKAILIGNPPFDPNSYLLEAPDIAKIIYEQYHPNPPAERKRGLLVDTHLQGNTFSSSELSLSPAPSFYVGGGIRVHPFVEIDSGFDWLPELSASGGGLSVSDGTTTRFYQHFYGYNGVVGGRFFPFYKKKWTTEPYLKAGYSWGRLIPNGSGDTLKGSGWDIGIGAMRPLSTHFFLESRLQYQALSYDRINFLGNEGQISPVIKEHRISLSLGLSWRL